MGSRSPAVAWNAGIQRGAVTCWRLYSCSYSRGTAAAAGRDVTKLVMVISGKVKD